MHYFAHTLPDAGPSTWQSLEEHLRNVSELAASFAPQQLQSLAQTAGLWHDIGKYQPAFQLYLGNHSEASNEGMPVASSVPHSAAGAALALERFSSTDTRGLLLALVIEAHHGALKPASEIADVTRERGSRLLEAARTGGLPEELLEEAPAISSKVSALGVRMLFSALIDADLLDTEQWDKGYGHAKPGIL